MPVAENLPPISSMQPVPTTLRVTKFRLRQLEAIALIREERESGKQQLGYNARPFASLGPGIPEPSGGKPVPPVSGYGIPCGHRVVGIPILGGLHHEYRLEKVAA